MTQPVNPPLQLDVQSLGADKMLTLARIAAELPESLGNQLDTFTARLAHTSDGRKALPVEQDTLGIPPQAPTPDEARLLLGNIYLALTDTDDRVFIKNLADRLGVALQHYVADPHELGNGGPGL